MQNTNANNTVLSGVKNVGLPYETPITYSALTGYLTCSSGVKGTRARITDSTVNTGGSTIAGSGSYLVPAVCNGTNWVVDGGSGGIAALTGDVAASGTGSVGATLATVNSGPGLCGDSTHVCQMTTNGKGLVTSQTPVAISGGGGGSGSGGYANITGSLTISGCTVSGGVCTVGTAVSSISFSSIPSNYSQLRIVINGQTSYGSNEDILMTLNSDTGSNYDWAYGVAAVNNPYGSGSTQAATAWHIGSLSSSSLTNRSNSNDVSLLNVNNTSYYRIFNALSSVWNGSTFQSTNLTGEWRNASNAITSMNFTTASGSNFVANTTIQIYGISDSVPAATGNVTNITSVLSASGCTISGNKCTVTSANASVTLSSIPGTYSNLELRFTGTNSTSGNVNVGFQFNGDTGSNYSYMQVGSGSGSPAQSSASGSTNMPLCQAGQTGSHSGSCRATITQYAGTTFFKDVIADTMSTFSTIARFSNSGEWANTAAITSITMIPSSGNFSVGDTFQIYGEP